MDSDPRFDDRSIASDLSERMDAQAMGPTSAVTQSTPAPWQNSTASPIGHLPGVQEQGPAEVQLQSPVSPSQRRETLQLNQGGGRSGTSPIIPNARFKAAVQKVLRMNRMRRLSDDEPGVNVASDSSMAIYGRIRERCSIEVIDYGPTKCKSIKLSNEELENHIAAESRTRPLWAKVRWINIGGISFDVIRCLALRYNIHPLAIEDIIHGRQTYSSKADYYVKHMFLRLLCHTLKEDDDDEPNVKPQATPGTFTSRDSETPPPTYASRQNTEPRPVSEDIKYEQDEGASSDKQFGGLFRRRAGTRSSERVKALASASLSGAQPWVAGSEALGDDVETVWAKSVYPNLGKPPRMSTARKYSFALASMFESNLESGRQSSTQATINELKKGERVEVKLRNLYIIMFRDGTLISIHQDVVNNFFNPIAARVRQRDTMLRNTADVSLLLQAMVDLVVDNGVKVVDKYQTQILKFERDILIRPKMRTVKALHVASGDLTMHKRTLGPLRTLIIGLRRYDLDRCIAQADPTAPGFDEKKVQGFMSHKSKIYLADVLDHMEYILASLEMFESVTENLIAYTFNIVSYDMNTTMRTLTTATVIFFPLSFLTGYFGMNFQKMLSVQAHSEAFFWTIAIPVMSFVIIVFNIPNIVSGLHWAKKRMIQRRLGSYAA